MTQFGVYWTSEVRCQMTYPVMRPLKAGRASLPVQTQQYLLTLIENGMYQPGDQLPSENELAAQLGISRPTLREALRNLEQDGVVIRKHGVGTFVSRAYGGRLDSGLERLESILELAARQGLQLTFDVLRVSETLADEELAKALQVAPGTGLTNVSRVIKGEGRPVAYMLDVVRSSLLSPADIDGTFNGSVLDLLRQKLDLQIDQAVADIVALDVDGGLAERLKIEPGQAVLLVEETLFDDEGVAIGYSRNFFNPDFFRFHIIRR